MLFQLRRIGYGRQLACARRGIGEISYEIHVLDDLCFFLPSAALAGPTSAPRKSQFEKAFNVIIASTTPDMFKDAREDLTSRYVDEKPNKALAVQPVYHQYFRSEHHEDQAVAGDRTLDACQLRLAKPCALLP